MGVLSDWLDGVVEKAKKVVEEEGVPFLEKIDKLGSELELSADEIKRRSDELVRQAEDEKKGRVVIDAEVVSDKKLDR
jgi:ATP-dependent protease HslVU (ClpYQ) ATPase subunit